MKEIILVVVVLERESDKREVNMKYQADFRFESNSISKEQSKPSISSFSPLSFTHLFIISAFILYTCAHVNIRLVTDHLISEESRGN